MIHQGFLGAMRAFHLPSLRLDVLSIRLEGIHKQDALGIYRRSGCMATAFLKIPVSPTRKGHKRINKCTYIKRVAYSEVTTG
jgi:hypothetical protein